MTTDKRVQEAREAVVARVEPAWDDTRRVYDFAAAELDALIQAVREDERWTCASEIEHAIDQASDYQHNSQLWGDDDGAGTLYIAPILRKWRGNA